MMFTKEVMEQFTELDFAVYDCIVKHKKQLHKITIKELAAMALKILVKSKCILFIGIGTSGILGKYGARYFSNVGYFSLFIDDPWLPILQNPSEGTVMIVLSESGMTTQTLYIASHLQQRGCPLISVTNNANSVLAKMADCNISYHVTERMVNDRNVTTQIPVLYIIETLAKRLYNEES